MLAMIIFHSAFFAGAILIIPLGLFCYWPTKMNLLVSFMQKVACQIDFNRIYMTVNFNRCFNFIQFCFCSIWLCCVDGSLMKKELVFDFLFFTFIFIF